jgi:hypothetical protein
VNLGAEPKKVAILAVIVVGGGLYYFLSSGDSTTPPAPRTIAPVADTTSPVRTVTKSTKAQTSSQSNGGEFILRVLGSRPDDHPDPTNLDPELKLDLLAKVQAVAPIEAGRNLFQYGAAPPPPAPIVLPKDVPKILPKPTVPAQSTVAVLGESRTPAVAPPTPINLKYYGYVVSKTDGRKEACLLDGEDIILATENETVKQRYKIVRIALTSVVIEDTQAKNTQTLQFQELPSS